MSLETCNKFRQATLKSARLLKALCKGGDMAKGFIVCGSINIIISGIFLFVAFNFLYPVKIFFIILSIVTLIPSVTMKLRTELAIKISNIALQISSFICGFMVLFSMAGVLNFSKSWAFSLILCFVYLILAFYFIGFKGYLREYAACRE